MYTPEQALQITEFAILVSGGTVTDEAREIMRKVAYGEITGDQAVDIIKECFPMPSFPNKETQEREEQLKEMNATAYQVNEIRKQEAIENEQ